MKRTATTEQVAAALHVKPATVRKYARARQVPFDSTPGGHRRFDVEEVLETLGLGEHSVDVAVLDTPYVRVPSGTTRRVTVRGVRVRVAGTPAHGTAEEHAAWSQRTDVV